MKEKKGREKKDKHIKEKEEGPKTSPYPSQSY